MPKETRNNQQIREDNAAIMARKLTGKSAGKAYDKAYMEEYSKPNGYKKGGKVTTKKKGK
jgi:hypothetical protein